MVFAGRLMLLMLPGPAPLLAVGLHFGKEGDQDEASRRTSLQHAEGAPGTGAAGRRVLLIVAGLARHIEETWPLLERALIVPNEEAGYTFTTYFSTNTGLGCHQGSPRWKYRQCEEPTDPRATVEQIKKLFAPRAVTVVDYTGLERVGIASSTHTCGIDDNGDLEIVVRAVDSSDETDDACNGWSWWDRVHKVLENIEPGARFDRMVSLRPDVVLSWGARAPLQEGPVVMRLDEMCKTKPGISFVTSSWTTTSPGWLHNRDFDFMHILCPGEKLSVYEEATKNPTRPCKGKDPMPSLPDGFKSRRGWTLRSPYCRFVQLFQMNNTEVSHWDDYYHLSWLPRFNHGSH